MEPLAKKHTFVRSRRDVHWSKLDDSTEALSVKRAGQVRLEASL